MFEKATRLKLRFETHKGNLTVEDLWDLPLTSTRGAANLNDVAKSLSRELKENADEDFVNKVSSANEILELKFEIVKRVIAVRLAENEEVRIKAETRARKERILEIIAKKQDDALEGKSLEELQQLAASL